MKRTLKPEERTKSDEANLFWALRDVSFSVGEAEVVHEDVVRAIAAGDRVKATNIYLSATEGNLTEAQNFVRAITAERGVERSQQLSKKTA